MSGLLAGKVWHSALPALLKPLAACLADEGTDEGQRIYPSIAYIAWKLGVSERTVQRGMSKLRGLGVILEAGKKQFGRTFVPVYFLDASKLPTRKLWAETRRGGTSVVTSMPDDTHVATSQRGGVTPATRRGDIAVAPNPLVDPLVEPVRKASAAKEPSPPDSRYQFFYNFACNEFKLKFLQPPTWAEKHTKGLKLFLNRNPDIDLPEWQRRYRIFLTSPDRFFQQHKGSLAYFVGNFDLFIETAMPGRSYDNGKSKVDVNQRTIDNLRAAGYADNGGGCA